ncbi:MAG: RDD family protein [Proteobacteria bacterium]|nr:RDD family protein [Pseudomonadota bacterium]
MKFLDSDTTLVQRLSPFQRKKDNEYSKYAGFNRRILAATIDSLLLMLLTPLFDAIAPIDRSGLEGMQMDNSDPKAARLMLSQLAANHALIESWLHNFILQMAFFIAYSGICWYFWQATLGKIILQMKVVDAKTLGPVSLSQIVRRMCGYVISGTCLMMGFFWIGLNKKQRAWHDYLADTVVITEPWKLPRPGEKPKPEKQETLTEESHETPAD